MKTKIDYKNKEIIEKLYVHDAYFTGFKYDYPENRIYIEAIEYYYGKKFHITFHDVIFFEMQSLDFWGKSLRILDWELCAKKNSSFAEIIENNKEDFKYARRKNVEDIIESVIVITSGDTLTIFCDNIDFVEETYHEAQESMKSNE